MAIICCLTPFATHAQTGTIMHDGVMRDYIYHLPSGYDTTQHYPLVINMHGLTSNASQEQLYTDMDAVADTGGFIVVYPNGLNNMWNAAFYNPGTDDLGFISALIDSLADRFSIDLQRVYATGMSNGGFMSYGLACGLSHKIAAIASVTGLMLNDMSPNCNNTRKVPVLQMHGTADPTVNYNGNNLYYLSGEATIDYWVQENNCPTDSIVTAIPDVNTSDQCTATKIYYGPCDEGREVILYRINGGEHTWPGATIDIGVTNHDIHGSSVIWNFFKRHSLDSSSVTVSSVEDRSQPAAAEIQVFPNPFSSNFEIQLSQSQDIQAITVTNLLQQILLQIPVEHRAGMRQTIRVDARQWPAGVYLLQMEGAAGRQTVKVLKQKK